MVLQKLNKGENIMTLLRFEPMRDFDHLSNRFQRIFDEFPGFQQMSKDTFLPKIDISENENNILIDAEIPGVPKENLKGFFPFVAKTLGQGIKLIICKGAERYGYKVNFMGASHQWRGLHAGGAENQPYYTERCVPKDHI